MQPMPSTAASSPSSPVLQDACESRSTCGVLLDPDLLLLHAAALLLLPRKRFNAVILPGVPLYVKNIYVAVDAQFQGLAGQTGFRQPQHPNQTRGNVCQQARAISTIIRNTAVSNVKALPE
jgi:hypothetical protein